jgi:hypothetical protein
MSAKNWKRASTFGWIGCFVGGLAIFYKIVCYYVLLTVGETPGTMIYVIRILDADVLAFVVGIPLGAWAWYLGRRRLGSVAIVLCGVSLLATLVRMIFRIV